MIKQNYFKFPIKRVHIELTNICNFDCRFCPKFKMTRKNGYMKPELAKKIIDELSEEDITEKITFHIMGEPFLHPEFFDIVEYASKKDIKVGITTNGSYLTEENSKRLIAMGVDQLNISLQTPSPESYKMRKSSDLDYNRYCSNILSSIDNMIASDRGTIIKIHFLNTKFNKAVKEAVGNIDVINSTIALRSVFGRWIKNIYSLESIKDQDAMRKTLKNINRVSINRWNVLEIYPNIYFETYMLDTWGNALRNNTIRKGYIGYCSALTDHFGILWNGDFILCCKDFDGNTMMANVTDRSILEILNSDEVLSIVNGFKKYRVIHSHCQKCLGGPTITSAVMKQLGSILFWDILKWYFYNKKRLY